jgi:hypothetical protein
MLVSRGAPRRAAHTTAYTAGMSSTQNTTSSMRSVPASPGSAANARVVMSKLASPDTGLIR